MQTLFDRTDRAILDEWQRDFPIHPDPFARMAAAIGTSEADVLARLDRMAATGRIARVGATCAPNTASASTLAAVAAPADQIDCVAALIGAQIGVNHCYERENRWNLWFVATGPDRAHVNATLRVISEDSGLEVLDLRLVRPFNVDLGFRLDDDKRSVPRPKSVDREKMRPGDRQILQQLSSGLPLVARPYAEMAARLDRSEAEVLERTAALQDAGLISRLGVIVRHRALGWRSNAMVVWDLPSDRIDEAGPRLAALRGVTLCYERRPAPGRWPYRLYNMIHARSRDEAHGVLEAARALPELAGVPHKVLFSTRCFKQTGALISLTAGDGRG